MGVRNADTNRFDRQDGMGPRAALGVGDIEFSIGAEAADIILVSAQLKDMRGENFAGYANVALSLHDASFGAVTSTALFSATPITVGSLLLELVTDKVALARTNSAGLVTLSITVGTATSYYCIASCADVTVQSPLIAFA